eukprot:945623-Rhodomonas_salina.1
MEIWGPKGVLVARLNVENKTNDLGNWMYDLRTKVRSQKHGSFFREDEYFVNAAWYVLGKKGYATRQNDGIAYDTFMRYCSAHVRYPVGQYGRLINAVDNALGLASGTAVKDRKNTVMVTIPEAKISLIFQAEDPFSSLQGNGWGGESTDDTPVSLGLPRADKLQTAGQGMPVVTMTYQMAVAGMPFVFGSVAEEVDVCFPAGMVKVLLSAIAS